VNERRATIAIVRRHVDRRFALDFVVQFALVGVIAFLFARLLYAWWTPLAIVSALAAAIAAERSHAESLRRVTFFAMPLYGRQLARAHAIAPALMALAVPLGYASGAALRREPLAASMFEATILAALVATLVSLSSVFRDGYRAGLYVVLATALAAAVTVAPLAFIGSPPRATLVAALLAFVAGFFALRAFGETLARYDPVP
jgi:hypothetical protein